MKFFIAFAICLSLVFLAGNDAFGQKPLRMKFTEPGVFSVGIRTGIVLSNSHPGWNVGQGWGIQTRIMATKQINTEWYFDFFHGGYGDEAVRTDGHIGALVFLYPQRRLQRVAPFLAIGPNADYVKLRDRENEENFDSRWSMAMQTGIGMHVHLTWRSDLTIMPSYMLHFGNEVKLQLDDGASVMLPQEGSGADGHFLITVSMSYKIADLWKRLRFR